jgi:AraC-like DNA-binding protein
MAIGHDESDYGFLRFATDDFPERDRLAHWREMCGRAMMKVDMDPLADEPFRCTAELRRLPQLGIASITTTPNRITRSRELIADGNNDFIFVVPIQGNAEIRQRNREASLSPNTAWLVASDQPSATVVQSFSRFVSLAIPAGILAPMVSAVESDLTAVIPDNVEAVRLLIGYLGCLRDDLVLATPATRQLVVSHIHDLVALAIGAARDVAEVARGRGMRAARLRAAKSDIMANLSRQDLSVDMVAFNQGVTGRYIRKLFESEGTSFSDFVLAQRLIRAHRMLGDLKVARTSISAIALAVGFGDISYFNRTFRRHFGATPSEVRRMMTAGP